MSQFVRGQFAVSGRYGVLRRALERSEVPGDGRGGGDYLAAGGAVADDTDALSGEIGVLRPGAGVQNLAFETLDPGGEGGHVGGRQETQTVDQESAAQREAAVGLHGPGAAGFIEVRTGHGGLEQEVLAQPITVDHAVEVLQDERLSHILGGPIRVNVQVTIERVLVDKTFRVRQAPGYLFQNHVPPTPAALSIHTALRPRSLRSLWSM